MVSSSQIKRYHVFLSFHGQDVRRGFLSHLHNHFASKGITTFKDQEIERGHSIGHELVQAIRESRVSIVLLSRNYASSGWCLDELVEILKCKEASGQIVMTIFYDVDPSSVRKQKGVFGSAFEKTCVGKTEEVKQRWARALTHVANIEGEHSLNWASEAEMIQKIATDVSRKLNVTPSRDFDEMVGMEAHLRKMSILLRLECDEVLMTGIWGPAGIGKTTIARALFNRLSAGFRLRCFMGNLKGSYRSIMGVDDYDSKLALQSKLLSKILNQERMMVEHLGTIKEWLQEQRVLIVLDDVDDLEQLEVLAKNSSWFGPGSRIIVTTKDKKILKAHGINDIYHVDFPSEEEALEILYLSAFKKSSPPDDGFEELSKKVVKFCGNLPLGLRVVGSSLYGVSEEDEWRLQIHGEETSLDRKVEDVLRVGYDKLLEKHQSLFLHIACVFNDCYVDNVARMLADSNLDVENGLKTLEDKSLVHISSDGWITMHCLLQKLGRQIVLQQSSEPGRRQFLVEVQDIRDVLENETGTGSVIGISFDMYKLSELSISGRAFEGMRNLKYLRIFNEGNVRLLDDMEYLPSLRLLDWDSYPRRRLPPRFRPEYLIELHMQYSELEKLWKGIQLLPNLKNIDLSESYKLKEIPNLSKATSLETLVLTCCESLVEIPSSISNLHKLKSLEALGCINLQVIPTDLNLASLENVDMSGCSRLRTLPNISKNVKTLQVLCSEIIDFPASVTGYWSTLECLDIGSSSLKRLTHAPRSLKKLNLSTSGIKTIPDCVRVLPRLEFLIVANCSKLVSISGLSPSLRYLVADDCVSLKRVCLPSHKPIKGLTLYNCFNLDGETRKGVMQRYVDWYACLPGKEVPAAFTHKATGSSVTVPLTAPGAFSASSRFKACLVLTPVVNFSKLYILCRLRSKGGTEIDNICEWQWLPNGPPQNLSEHLFILCDDLFDEQDGEVDLTTMEEMVFEFSCKGNDDKILGCGVQILGEERETSSSECNIRDGGGDYEQGALEVSSQVENIKNTIGHLMLSSMKRLLLCNSKLSRKKPKQTPDNNHSDRKKEDIMNKA